MRATPVAVLVVLFAAVGILLALSTSRGAPPAVEAVPVRAGLPHAVKASMPLHPPQLRTVR